MELWKKTFHDSHEYISLIFDNYFEKGIYVYKEENDHIIAAILGIPYTFALGDFELKGLYLCGISVDYKFRREGIMTSLLQEIEEKARGFYDFTFLIPADETLRIIYENKGYYDFVYKVYEYYTDIHDFKTEFESTLLQFDERIKLLKQKRYDSLSVLRYSEDPENLRKKIIDFILASEASAKQYLVLRHTEEDLVAALIDNHLSKGEVFVAINPDREISCVMFTVPANDERIKVNAQFCHDACAFFRTLDKIKNTYAEMPLTIERYPEEVKDVSLWSENSVVPNPDGQSLESLVGIETRVFYSADHSHPYAMLKDFNIEALLKVVARIRNDISFRLIVIKETSPGFYYVEVKKGEALVKNLDSDLESLKKSYKGVSILYERDFLKILLRRKRKDDIIMEAFGIPRLPVNISLMLD